MKYRSEQASHCSDSVCAQLCFLSDHLPGRERGKRKGISVRHGCEALKSPEGGDLRMRNEALGSPVFVYGMLN